MGKFEFEPAQELILCKANVINGNRSIFLKLAVDTGASITMISVETALAVGIDPSKSSRHIEITTAGGIAFVPIIKVPIFKCFGFEVKNMDVICHNLPPQGAVEGLLGLNFLRDAKVAIDFSTNTIGLHE